MNLLQFRKILAPMTLGVTLTVSSLALSEPSGPKLTEPLMDQAIDFFGVLRGQEISGDDRAWLKQQWYDEARVMPKAVATRVDDLAVLYERHQKAPDPLRLANSRINILKNVYCTAKQTSDPIANRLGNILAPDDLVLAADCILGLVVTRFDVDAIVAAHALTADIAGRQHDPDADKLGMVTYIVEQFEATTTLEKALLARAELRHATFARFWSRIDGTPEQRAVADALQTNTGQGLKSAARELESLALSRLDTHDYLAKVGDIKFTAATFDNYVNYFELIAGYSFSSRDLAWMQDSLIDEFREITTRSLDEIGQMRKLTTKYLASSNVADRAAMRSAWAGHIYCTFGQSSDPIRLRVADIVFRHDPVVSADCETKKVNRKSHSVVAESGGQTLTERDLETALRYTSVLLGRALLPAEEAVVREERIQTFQSDQATWNEEFQGFKTLLAKVDKHRANRFLAMDERKRFFDWAYCYQRASDGPFADHYVEMFRLGESIVFEDCDQKLVTTEQELDAIAEFNNFLALINHMPPPSQADTEKLRQSLMTQNMNLAESSLLAVREWWSLLTLDEKATEAARMRENGISPDGAASDITSFVDSVRRRTVLMNARIQSCMTTATIIQGQTAIYRASLAPFSATSGNPSGIPGGQLAGLVSSTRAAAELCGDVRIQ